MSALKIRANPACRLPEPLSRLLGQVDSSWIDTLPEGALLQRIGLQGRAGPWLRMYLAEHLGLSPEDQLGLDLDATAYEQLDAAELRGLVHCAGCCVATPRLRSVVDGERVRSLVQSLGEGFYTFALRHGLELTPGADIGGLATCGIGDLPGHVRRSGMGVMVAAAQRLGGQRLHQLLLKLPLSWAEGAIHLHRPLAPEMAHALMLRIIHEGVLHGSAQTQT